MKVSSPFPQAHASSPAVSRIAVAFQYGDQGIILIHSKNTWSLPSDLIFSGESLESAITRIALEHLGLHIHAKYRILLDQLTAPSPTEKTLSEVVSGYLIKLDGSETITVHSKDDTEFRPFTTLPLEVDETTRQLFPRALNHLKRNLPPPRTTGDILFEKATELGYQPKKLTDYGVFSFFAHGKEHYFFHSILPFNSQIATYAATDKYTTRLVLETIREKNIPYCLPKNLSEAKTFFEANAPIIVKPTTGQRAENIHKVSHWEELRNLPWQNSLLEKYIDGVEIRVLMLDGQAFGIAEKTLAPLPDKPWEKRWRVLSANEHTSSLVERTKKILKALGLRWGAVDYIRDKEGTSWVLEVNASPGFVHFHEPHQGPAQDIAGKVLQAILADTSSL